MPGTAQEWATNANLLRYTLQREIVEQPAAAAVLVDQGADMIPY